jgi:hypothetical protein
VILPDFTALGHKHLLVDATRFANRIHQLLLALAVPETPPHYELDDILVRVLATEIREPLVSAMDNEAANAPNKNGAANHHAEAAYVVFEPGEDRNNTAKNHDGSDGCRTKALFLCHTKPPHTWESF